MKESKIGARLREKRIERALTQKQVADYVGVTEATVSRWESGEIDNMRRDKIASLSAVLKVSPLLIMGIDEPDDEQANDHEETKMVHIYRTLNLEGRSIFKGVLKSLSNTYSANVTV